MELPHEYPYNPRPRLIFLVSGVGPLWIGVQRLSWGRMPTGFNLWFGLVPIMLALLLGMRRVAFDRRLLLDKDGMILPTAFFRGELRGLLTLVSSAFGGITSRRPLSST